MTIRRRAAPVPSRARSSVRPAVVTALLALGAAAAAQTPPPLPARPAAGSGLRLLPTLPGGRAGAPVEIEAERLSGRPGLDSVAEGAVRLQRGPLSLQADRLEYDLPSDTARATGSVQIELGGNVFRGPEVQLRLERFEGYFESPSYFLGRTQAGGSAQRFDFIDEYRGVATGATYTSCPAPEPAWILSTDSVRLDTARDEGQASGAVLRFYGVPILAAPSLSFPLSDARKSGWLPPNINLDNRSGVELAVPYYWNIAPNRDATFTPTALLRRGVALGTEFRYLEPGYQGELQAFALPGDRVAGRSRWSLNLDHEARWTGRRVGAIDYSVALQRASDDDFWKDISTRLPSLTPRLLPASVQALRRFDTGWGEAEVYAGVQHWQVLQEPELASRIVAPYEREPRLGVRQNGSGHGLAWSWEAEVNRFVNDDPALIEGTRVHALGALARPWSPLGTPGWTVTPRASFNVASYDVDRPLPGGGGRSVSRAIPSASLDSEWVFERASQAFGRDLTQTLEPRLLYVLTPYRDPARLPNFDSAANDFNLTSIYADNAFSGIDRVSDAHQITAGVTTRFLDRDTGVETLRLAVAQRVLLRDQRITPDGTPITRRLSDLLLLGATNLLPHWWLDGTLQYNADVGGAQRAIVSSRYSPGPFRTLSLSYRFTRDASQQYEFGWQWPLNEQARQHATATLARDAQRRDGVAGPRPAAAQGCPGAWYGVGRINYSQRDSRLTDALVGFEYDSGCWIGRLVAERISTGRTQATTRLLLQLELVGLSRLGSNPLKTLRDNIPGYRLLRDEAPALTPSLSTP